MSETHKRYGYRNMPTMPSNICGLNPDAHHTVPVVACGWEWLGDIDPCGMEMDRLKEAIKANGDTAVGLYWEVAATPAKVELDSIWYENMSAVPGLKIKLTVHDIYGDEIEAISEPDVDLGIEPCDEQGCPSGECESGGEDTFYAYRFDNSADNGKVGRGDSAMVRLEIVEEPEGGLLGDNCANMSPILFTGGLLYRPYCNIRNIVSYMGKDFSCLDGATTEGLEKWEASDRKAELGV